MTFGSNMTFIGCVRTYGLLSIFGPPVIRKESVCNSIGSHLVPSLWCRPSWEVLISKYQQSTVNSLSIVSGWTYDISAHMSSRRLHFYILIVSCLSFEINYIQYGRHHSEGAKSEQIELQTDSLRLTHRSYTIYAIFVSLLFKIAIPLLYLTIRMNEFKTLI